MLCITIPLQEVEEVVTEETLPAAGPKSVPVGPRSAGGNPASSAPPSAAVGASAKAAGAWS